MTEFKPVEDEDGAEVLVTLRTTPRRVLTRNPALHNSVDCVLADMGGRQQNEGGEGSKRVPFPEMGCDLEEVNSEEDEEDDGVSLRPLSWQDNWLFCQKRNSTKYYHSSGNKMPIFTEPVAMLVPNPNLVTR